MVEGHSKSIVLGGGVVLFPMTDEAIHTNAAKIKAVIADAEIEAFDRGYAAAQLAIRRAAGLSR